MSCRATKAPFLLVNVCPTYSMLTNFSMVSILAVAIAATQGKQGQVKGQADDADDENRDKNVGDVQVVPFVPEPEANARATGEHFGGNNDQPRRADGEPDTRQQVGQDGG